MNTQHSSLTWVRRCGALVAAMTLTLIPVQAQETIDIQCSPSVVVLGSVAAGDCLTVHADIPYSAVDTDAGVFLNGVAAYATFADNRGDLVAKFDLTDMKALLTPPATVLTLTGTAIVDELVTVEFTGADEVRVVASTPRVDPPRPRVQQRAKQMLQQRMRLVDCQ